MLFLQVAESEMQRILQSCYWAPFRLLRNGPGSYKFRIIGPTGSAERESDKNKQR